MKWLRTLAFIGTVLMPLLLASIVCEANNPMPTPDWDEVCQYDCGGGPSFSFVGLLWGAGVIGVFWWLGSKLG
jgi:hypothetical protein